VALPPLSTRVYGERNNRFHTLLCLEGGSMGAGTGWAGWARAPLENIWVGTAHPEFPSLVIV